MKRRSGSVKHEKPSRSAVLLSNHFFDQRRRGGFHWLADELSRREFTVSFATMGFSRLSLLTNDVRLQGMARLLPRGSHMTNNRAVRNIVNWPLAHPINRFFDVGGLAQHAAAALYVRSWIRCIKSSSLDPDLVVFESGLPLLLAGHLRSLFPRAAIVYRVSDDVRVLRLSKRIVDAEARLRGIDRVSVASPRLAERFAGLAPVGVDPMGLERSAFPAHALDPYTRAGWEKELVCSGTSQIDVDTVQVMAMLRPRWRFHIIGRLRSPLKAPNIVTYGELPFAEVAGFVLHADVGLAPYLDRPGVEYQTFHSNRILQYRFARLPILAPRSLVHQEVPNIIGYEPTDASSIETSLIQAQVMDRSSLVCDVPGWDVLCERILRGVGLSC